MLSGESDVILRTINIYAIQIILEITFLIINQYDGKRFIWSRFDCCGHN